MAADKNLIQGQLTMLEAGRDTSVSSFFGELTSQMKKIQEDLNASTTALTKDMNFVSKALNNLIGQSKKEEKKAAPSVATVATYSDNTTASANFNTDKYNETYDPNKDKVTLP